MERLCECNSHDCTAAIDLSFEETVEIQRSSLIFIIEACKHGPDPTDQLVEKRDGYSLYRE